MLEHDIVEVDVDYFENSLWGGWFDKKSGMPNVIALSPSDVIKTTNNILKMRKQIAQFRVSEMAIFINKLM